MVFKYKPVYIGTENAVEISLKFKVRFQFFEKKPLLYTCILFDLHKKQLKNECNGI